MMTSPASFASPDLVSRVAANLAHVRARIVNSGGDPSRVRIVAVTKTFGVDAVHAAAAVGLRTMGENYVDELCDKRDAVGPLDVAWHFLGALQSNKITRAVHCAEVLCSVSRMKELDGIARVQPGQALYVQVDFTGAPRRSGAPPTQVEALVRAGRALDLAVRGLMTIAPPDPDGAREAFRGLRTLADDLGLVERSMGMSDDLEIACEFATTEVRIGRALFGPRSVAGAP